MDERCVYILLICILPFLEYYIMLLDLFFIHIFSVSRLIKNWTKASQCMSVSTESISQLTEKSPGTFV